MTGRVYYITGRKFQMASKDPAGLGLAVIPAIIYSQLFAQKFLFGYTGGSRLAATVLVIAGYLVLSQVPYMCIGIAAANTVMYIGMLWVLMDMFSVAWIRIFFKAVTVVAVVLMELGICTSIMGKRK